MSEEIQKVESPEEKEPTQKWLVAGIIVFFVSGFLFASPCLCRTGAIKGFYRMIFYVVVLGRMLYGLHKKNFQLADYLIWVGFFVVFCILVEVI